MALKRFHGGRVYTSAFAQPIDELWVYERLVVQPEQAAKLQAADASLEVTQVDLNGATVLPAFRDGHTHPLFAAREALGLHITHCHDVEAVLDELRVYARQNATVDWIDGATYERDILAGLEGLAATLLDNVVADRPVVLHADDHHTLWVNSEALKAAGLDSAVAVADATAKIAHGSIDIDTAGNATGILREWEAMSLVLDRAPKLTQEQDFAALELAQRDLIASGLVAVVDAWIDRGMAEVYLAFARAGKLRLRVDLAFRFAPGQWRDDLDYFKTMRDEIAAAGQANLTARTAKFFADGAFGSATAHVHEPYLGQTPGGEPNGQPVWSADEFAEATSAAKAAGFALHIHAIGDAAIDQAIEAIAAAGAPKNSVITHVELASPTAFARMAQLGIAANYEPYWAQRNAMLNSCLPKLGRERFDSLYQMRTAIVAGVAISFGSDWPVSSYIPLEGIQVALTRATLEAPEDRWTPEEALTVQESLHAYTSAVAAQMGDAGAGTLEPNMSADFILLEHDPNTIAPKDLAKCNVLATYIGGQDVTAI